MTVAEFLAAFPEFSDATKYPPARIQLYLTLAASRVSECNWGDAYTLGVGDTALRRLTQSLEDEVQREGNA